MTGKEGAETAGKVGFWQADPENSIVWRGVKNSSAADPLQVRHADMFLSNEDELYD